MKGLIAGILRPASVFIILRPLWRKQIGVKKWAAASLDEVSLQYKTSEQVTRKKRKMHLKVNNTCQIKPRRTDSWSLITQIYFFSHV